MTLLPHKFGPYGGQFVPETLMPALIELEEAFVSSRKNVEFQKEFNRLMASFVGRPTPLTYAKRLSEKLGGAQIYLKREDLAHTGAQARGEGQAPFRPDGALVHAFELVFHGVFDRNDLKPLSPFVAAHRDITPESSQTGRDCLAAHSSLCW